MSLRLHLQIKSLQHLDISSNSLGIQVRKRARGDGGRGLSEGRKKVMCE